MHVYREQAKHRVPALSVTLLVVGAFVLVQSIPAAARTDSHRDAHPPTPRAVEFQEPPPTPETHPPLYQQNPNLCDAKQVEASATTHDTRGGVLGVVRLKGEPVGRYNRPCEVSFPSGPGKLLDASSHRLDVPRSRGDQSDPPYNYDRTDPVVAGDDAWGFLWFGSWCGKRAAYVQLSRGSVKLRVPLSGPEPTCRHHMSRSKLVEGEQGALDDGTEPAPSAYKHFSLTAAFTGATTSDEGASVNVTLMNNGKAAIPLTPCPQWAATRENYRSDSSEPRPRSYVKKALPCTASTPMINPGGDIVFTVPGEKLNNAKDGSIYEVDIWIGGVPEATATETVQSSSGNP